MQPGAKFRRNPGPGDGIPLAIRFLYMEPLILVVDDDPAVLRLANLLLSANGYEVLTAVRGLEALRLVRAYRPSVVVLDITPTPSTSGIAMSRSSVRSLRPIRSAQARARCSARNAMAS